MKDTRTMQEQVAELSYEQKLSIMKIRKCAVIFEAFLMVILVVALALTVFFHIQAADAKDEADRIDTMRKLDAINGKFSLNSFDEWEEAFDRYCDMQDAGMYTMLIGGVVLVLGGVGELVYIKTKYPYYSDKKYKYIKKNGIM